MLLFSFLFSIHGHVREKNTGLKLPQCKLLMFFIECYVSCADEDTDAFVLLSDQIAIDKGYIQLKLISEATMERSRFLTRDYSELPLV